MLTRQRLDDLLFNGALVSMIVTPVMDLGMGFAVAQVLPPMCRVGFLLGRVG